MLLVSLSIFTIPHLLHKSGKQKEFQKLYYLNAVHGVKKDNNFENVRVIYIFKHFVLF